MPMSPRFLLALLLCASACLLFASCCRAQQLRRELSLPTPSTPATPAASLLTSNASLHTRPPRHMRADASTPRSSSNASSASASAFASSSHQFRPLQAQEEFRLRLLTEHAPWSTRIQPALLYQTKPTSYTQWLTGVTVSTGSPWLILFEGSLSAEVDGRWQNENDVWVSVDYGRTWDLMAGISRFGATGYHESGSPNSSFMPRGGANNCEDPASDFVFSIGGTFNGPLAQDVATNQVWYSSDGKQWELQDTAVSFVPNRYFSSCDIDSAGHIYTMGGVNQDQNAPNGRLLNDVWSTSIVTGLRQWRRITDHAAWSPRAEHLVLVGESAVLQKEIIYVIGGMTTWLEAGEYTVQSNDVWASSDGGYQWQFITLSPGFLRRWGHGGVFTAEGVLLVWGGSNTDSGWYDDMYSYRDIWTSFDGGRIWSQCYVPQGDDADRAWIRTEQGITLTADQRLIVASGYSYDGSGHRYPYNDVWMSDFSLSDIDYLGTICNAARPAAGIGLRVWRTDATPSSNVFTMTVQTRRAPWSARRAPALLVMNKPITYKQAGTQLTVSTTPNWLLMYEGALPANTEFGYTPENDVWASADLGQTWDLIAGVSINGPNGQQESAQHARTSFPHRAFSNNCEDPSNDDVFSLGGLYGTSLATAYASNDVWHSSDAVNWVRRSGTLTSFTPGRFQSSCDVDTNHVLYVAGGSTFAEPPLLNDVWTATNQGRNWKLATARAPWRARADHLVLIHNNIPFGRVLLYVIGGLSAGGRGSISLENDVWASSDGGVSWAVITGNAPWNRRWGMSGVVTDNGVMLIIGGTTTSDGYSESFMSLRDMWLSLDGGYTWSVCTLPSDHGYVRGQQGTALTQDGRLLLASGYAYQIGAPRTDYTDLWISNISVTNAQRMSDVCGGYALPTAGLGLRLWPGSYVAPTDPTLSAIAIAGIVSLIIVVAATLGFCYWSWKKTGRFPVPDFMQPAPRAPRQPASHGDYFVPGTGGGGFGTSTGGGGLGLGKDRDAFSSFESGAGDSDYRPPTGGYIPPGANGGSHGLLS